MSTRTLSLSLLAILLATSQIRGQTSLTWKWHQGEKLAYVIDEDSTFKSVATKLPRGGPPSLNYFELSEHLIFDTMWSVKSVTPNREAQIDVTIERVRFTANGKGAASRIKSLTLDSAAENVSLGEPDRFVFGLLKAMVGSTITVTINERGDVSKCELSEALRTRLQDNTAREVAGFFGDIFTEDGIRHRLTSWLVAFPKTPIVKGDTWQQEHSSRLGKSILGVHSYTFAGTANLSGRMVLRIEVKPELKLRPTVRSTRPERLPPDKITEQNGQGIVYFDDRTGRIVELTLTQHAIVESFFAETTLDVKTTVKLRSNENH